jgi:hypothetical protein
VGLLLDGCPVLAPHWNGDDRSLVKAIYLYSWVGGGAGGFVWSHYTEPWTDGTPRDRGMGYQVRHREVYLDLSVPAGLDVASRYIGTHYRLTFNTAPEFDRYVFGYSDRIEGWAIRGGDMTVVFVDATVAATSAWPTVRVAGLDKCETMAEAMALVVEHCAMEGK